MKIKIYLIIANLSFNKTALYQLPTYNLHTLLSKSSDEGFNEELYNHSLTLHSQFEFPYELTLKLQTYH